MIGNQYAHKTFTSHGLQSCRLLICFLLTLSGCTKPDFIPSTKIKDLPENREILKVIEAYRQAMEKRDATAVLILVHPGYNDNSGTPEGSDDVDYDNLGKILNDQFKRTTKIRYRIEYQGLKTKGREAEVDTYIDATFVYEPPGSSTPRWKRLTDYNRFRLLKEGNRWLFLSGI